MKKNIKNLIKWHLNYKKYKNLNTIKNRILNSEI